MLCSMPRSGCKSRGARAAEEGYQLHCSRTMRQPHITRCSCRVCADPKATPPGPTTNAPKRQSASTGQFHEPCLNYTASHH
ncbi:hypothetical protein NDU88_011913 [Pleurodeles waltl]|uniref:Uncharacterized protein n=1 Tax=Pleurodeles waltl TaxID=8319 RepID=A0AAV7R1F7_PLEWA|nr:hypothetical protein NDU88_011913 [Pleurodeles waltl]